MELCELDMMPSAKAVDGHMPRCKTCDTPFKSAISDWGSPGNYNPTAYCERCGWSSPYIGPQRPNMCLTCRHCAGVAERGKEKGRGLCADGMYQDTDGQWFTQYGQVNKLPAMHPQLDCAYYESAKGKTRDEIRIQDPLLFYRKTG